MVNRESIIETLYAKLHHLPTSSGKFNDIKYTYNSVERLLRQLKSQGEAINEQKMLIYQILSKLPLEVVLKLEDAKKCGVEWTMQLLRKLLNQHITIQESAQRRVANAKGRVYTNDSRQAKQDDARNTYPSSAELNKGDRRMYNETLLILLLLMFAKEMVRTCVVYFVKVTTTMMNVRNLNCSVSVNRG